jgi:hypothetical protein
MCCNTEVRPHSLIIALNKPIPLRPYGLRCFCISIFAAKGLVLLEAELNCTSMTLHNLPRRQS